MQYFEKQKRNLIKNYSHLIKKNELKLSLSFLNYYFKYSDKIYANEELFNLKNKNENLRSIH